MHKIVNSQPLLLPRRHQLLLPFSQLLLASFDSLERLTLLPEQLGLLVCNVQQSLMPLTLAHAVFLSIFLQLLGVLHWTRGELLLRKRRLTLGQTHKTFHALFSLVLFFACLHFKYATLGLLFSDRLWW